MLRTGSGLGVPDTALRTRIRRMTLTILPVIVVSKSDVHRNDFTALYPCLNSGTSSIVIFPLRLAYVFLVFNARQPQGHSGYQ